MRSDHKSILMDLIAMIKAINNVLPQVISLTEKLQGKVMPPLATTVAQEVDHLDDPKAVTGTEKLLVQQLKENPGSGNCAVNGVLSSEEDGGVVSDEGCSFVDFADTLFAVGVAEEKQLGSLASWFWN
jgi:homeobox-leucine zipper protein